ncbi:hypothetical protein EB822_09470 [Flavobacteriaceae bacterium PRS1]|nr:hypothetical protein EB822_09470 [Flavobacteriaceae bacterium PRS1]
MNNTILELSKVIFWDTDQKSLCWKENAHYIISKVVQYGNLKDWNIIKNHYTTKRLEAEVINMRYLDKKTLSYLSMFFNIPKKEFRCYTTKQSIQKHWNF